MYEWRKMTPEQRAEALACRKAKHHPWHKPPHEGGTENTYLVSAACYEHKHIIGVTALRISDYEKSLLDTARPLSKDIHAWVVLPNHYHILLRTRNVKLVLKALGKLHGKTSYLWNKEDGLQGRKVWHGCVERRIRSERHFWASMNYVHHNPIKHGYVSRWQDWPFSSAAIYLKEMGREEAERKWREFPLLDYGEGWDDPEM